MSNIFTTPTRRGICFAVCACFIVAFLTTLIVVLVSPSFFTAIYTSEEYPIATKWTVVIGSLVQISICIELCIGLKKKSVRLLSVWLVISIVFWKVHFFICLFSLINFVTTYGHADLKYTFQRVITLVIVQAIWLILIGVVWSYWRKLCPISDIPTYMQRKLELSRNSTDTLAGETGEDTESTLGDRELATTSLSRNAPTTSTN